MPFLYILPRPGAKAAPVDPARLEGLLCPYRGALSRMRLGGGELHASSLAGISDGGVQIPAATRKNPQTAWLEIQSGAEGLRFTTDPLGTFPLWIAEDDTRLIVTSEVKSLRALGDFEIVFEPERWPASEKRPPNYSPYANVRRLLPGAALCVVPDGLPHEERRAPLEYRPRAQLSSAAVQKHELDQALLASARAIAAANGPWGTFLSGGVDSSTATALLARHHRDLATYTLGTEHSDEYADAEALASFLGTKHHRIFATGEDALEHFERAVFANETIDGLTAETLAQLSVLARAAATGVRRIATGYGADLLFGSMLRHELYMKVTGVDDLQSLIERTAWSGEFAPFYAWSLGVEVHHLFWDPAVMNCAFRIPPEASFDGTTEKIALRTLTVEQGYLREEHAFRKKQALTDGTQFNRVLSAALGIEQKYAYEEKSARAIAALRKLYSGDQP